MNPSDVPYRIAAVETLLRAALPFNKALISVERLDRSRAEDERLFPQFSVDRYFVSIRGGVMHYCISGVLEWGVFWYRLDEGEPRVPTTEALLWVTIDRLPTIVANVATRLSGASSSKPV
jgi:hypothetical protein